MQSPGHALAVSIVQLIVLLMVCISRVITAARAMQNVSKLVCTHGGCFSSYAAFCGIFGAVEILLSMVPSLEEASWISVFGSSCSMVYLLITIVLGFRKGMMKIGVNEVAFFSLVYCYGKEKEGFRGVQSMTT
jgi:hypothetical protein